jgi:hypothetical protein
MKRFPFTETLQFLRSRLLDDDDDDDAAAAADDDDDNGDDDGQISYTECSKP